MESYELRSVYEVLTEELEQTALTSPNYTTIRELRRWVADKALMLDLESQRKYRVEQAAKAAKQ